MAILKPPSRQKRDLPRQQLTRIFRFVKHGSPYVCCLATSFPWDKKGALMRENRLARLMREKTLAARSRALERHTITS